MCHLNTVLNLNARIYLIRLNVNNVKLEDLFYPGIFFTLRGFQFFLMLSTPISFYHLHITILR